ncbi:hypothetical protein F5879DRAFT_347103 [Lentinula edodes]|nr:hypothetical protein F5879DRAFT_347103 [Lentinula edodes]
MFNDHCKQGPRIEILRGRLRLPWSFKVVQPSPMSTLVTSQKLLASFAALLVIISFFSSQKLKKKPWSLRSKYVIPIILSTEMLFRPVYLILGMFSAVYAAPFNTATGSGLDSLASTLITRSQGSLSHTNGNAGHLQTNGHNQGLNGHSTASESTKFEVWFSGDTKPPRPSTPSDVSNEIKLDVCHAINSWQGSSARPNDLIFLEPYSTTSGGFWYEEEGIHDGSIRFLLLRSSLRR